MSFVDIRVVVLLGVSTFWEVLEEYLYCSWPAGVVVNLQRVVLC